MQGALCKFKNMFAPGLLTGVGLIKAAASSFGERDRELCMAADVFSLFLQDFTGRPLIQMEILGYLAVVPKRPSPRTLGSQGCWQESGAGVRAVPGVQEGLSLCPAIGGTSSQVGRE